MVTGDVTINASPKSAVLGDVITFTGRVLLDGIPAPDIWTTIYLDTSPAPHVTLANGYTDSDGYYNIKWTSNYDGSLPIYARAATYQGFNSPIIIVPILKAGVEVHLDPRLHGALLEFRYRSYGRDEFLYSKLSVAGRTEWPQGTFTLYDLFEVRFPAQTVGGVSYLEASTGTFMYQNAPLIYTLELQTPVGIPTTTTITIPDKVGLGEKFYISGILYETDSGIPIPNQPINHSYNGKSLGGSTTGVDGDYLKEVSVPEPGVWALKSEFPGTETLQSSRSQANAVVATTPLEAILAIIGTATTGIALIVLCLN